MDRKVRRNTILNHALIELRHRRKLKGEEDSGFSLLAGRLSRVDRRSSVLACGLLLILRYLSLVTRRSSSSFLYKYILIATVITLRSYMLIFGNDTKE